MLFFDLEEGDVEDCPIRVCYSDDFDADFVCDTVETLLSCIKK